MHARNHHENKNDEFAPPNIKLQNTVTHLRWFLKSKKGAGTQSLPAGISELTCFKFSVWGLKRSIFIFTHRRKEGLRSISASIVSANIQGIGRWSVVFNLVRMVAWTTLTWGLC